MKTLVPLLLLLHSYEFTAAATYSVSTASKLNSALRVVNPGDKILLSPGSYYGYFKANRNGTSFSRITLEGPPEAILSSWTYGFHLKGNYWTLRGFTVSDAKKGIIIDYASNSIIENITVHTIQDEGIAFRFNSTDNIVRNSKIYNTGTLHPGIGEGIYIGTDRSKWKNGQPDKCDRIQILNNTIGPNVRAEGIDIKAGTCCGLIKGNYLDGHGLSNVNFADSWMAVMGNSYTIEDNRGYWTIKDGIQVRDYMPAGSSEVSGCNNVFRNNHCDLHSNGYCIFFANKKKCRNNVGEGNTFSSGGSLTNL